MRPLPRRRQCIQRPKDLLRRSPDFVGLRERAPGDPAIAAHDENGRPGDAVFGVLDAVSAYGGKPAIREKREAESSLGGQRGGIRGRIDRDRDDRCAAAAELVQVSLQLTELHAAVGSPRSTVEDQHHCPLPKIVRKNERATAGRGQGECRGPVADFQRALLQRRRRRESCGMLGHVRRSAEERDACHGQKGNTPHPTARSSSSISDGGT